MMKFLTNAFFTIAVILFFTALTISFILIQFMINRHLVIDEKNVNLFDLMLKASFALIGSSLSGFVAFLIFFLGDRKKEKEKAETEAKILSKITEEANNNLGIYNQMLSFFPDTNSEQLAELLHRENSKIKEGFLIYYTKLDYTIIQASLKDINEKSYLSNITLWRKQKVIYDYLELLLTKIHTKESTITLLDLIKSELLSVTKK